MDPKKRFEGLSLFIVSHGIHSIIRKTRTN